MQDRCVVISGASGFIGKNLVRLMSCLGIETHALVCTDSSTQELNKLPNVKCHLINLSLESSLEYPLHKKVGAFIHLAWKGTSPESRDVLSIQQENLQISLNAIKCASSVNAEKFISLGSTLEYTANEGGIIDQCAKPSPVNFYSAIKLACRFLCATKCRNLGMPFIYAIATSVYGPYRKDNNVITYTIKKLLAGEKPSLTSLEQRWDFIHIDDLVTALYLISSKCNSDAVYVVGRGDNWKLRDYIFKVRDIINSQAELGIGEMPQLTIGALPSSCVDISKLRNDTGFEPRIEFEKGIKGVIDWVITCQ